MGSVTRQYLRHRCDLPVRCRRSSEPRACHTRLKDLGLGGVCFRSPRPFEPGTCLEVSFPILQSEQCLRGHVAWSRRDGDGYEVGLCFDDEAEAFKARMVEQLAAIEAYRHEALKREGRDLSTEAAAREWIARHAAVFPDAPGTAH